MSRLLKDILYETKDGRTKYSIGRVLLFFSAICFFALNIALGVGAITGAIFEDKETLLTVSQNLRWALGTFGLYVLGGKGVGAFRDSQTYTQTGKIKDSDNYYPGYHQHNYDNHHHDHIDDVSDSEPKEEKSEKKKKDDNQDFYKPGNEEVN